MEGKHRKTRIDWRYLAGLFDGEGCVMIKRDKGWLAPRHSLKISITNTYSPVLYWIKETVGGSVGHSKTASEEFGWKEHYYWSASTKGAERFLRKIYPYTRIKYPMIKIALQLRDLINSRHYAGSNHVPAKQILKRDKLRQQLMALNHKHSNKNKQGGINNDTRLPK